MVIGLGCGMGLSGGCAATANTDPGLSYLTSLDGLTTNPTYGPVAQIGTTLTCIVDGFSSMQPAFVTYQWFSLSQGDLAGATAASFVVPAGLDTDDIACRVMPDGYPTSATTLAKVRYAPPVALGLPSLEFTLQQGGGSVSSDATVGFSGGGLVYSSSGAGAAVIHPITGLFTISTSATLALTLSVTAANSGGEVTTAVDLTITEGLAAPHLVKSFSNGPKQFTISGYENDLILVSVATPEANAVTSFDPDPGFVEVSANALPIQLGNSGYHAKTYAFKVAAGGLGPVEIVTTTSSYNIHGVYAANLGPYTVASYHAASGDFKAGQSHVLGTVGGTQVSGLANGKNVMVLASSHNVIDGYIPNYALPATETDLPSFEAILGGDPYGLSYIVVEQGETDGPVPQVIYDRGHYLEKGHGVIVLAPDVALPVMPLPSQYTAQDNGPDLAASATVHDITIEEFSFALDQTYEVGHYVTGNLFLGDIWVKTDDTTGTVVLNGWTPAPQSLPDVRNGAMLNPEALVSGSNAQGFDTRNTGNASAPYLDARNAASNLPLTLVAGDSLVVALSAALPTNAQDTIDKFVVLTVVDDIPYADEYRPPYTWDTALGPKPRFRRSDAARVLPRLGGTSSDPTGLDPSPDDFNRFMLDIAITPQRENLQSKGHPGIYGGANGSSAAFANLISDVDLSQKQPTIDGMVQRGIDRFGIYTHAKAAGFFPWVSDGGQMPTRQEQIVFAGWMLGGTPMADPNAPGASFADIMVNIAIHGSNDPLNPNQSFSETGQTLHVTQALVDATTGLGWTPGTFPASSNTHPYEQGMLDGQGLLYSMPEWAGRTQQNTPATMNAHLNGTAYRDASYLHFQQAMMLAMHAMGLADSWRSPATWDWIVRAWYLYRGLEDPWIKAGGVSDRYSPVPGALTFIPSDTYRRRLFEANIASFYTFPWGDPPS